MKIARSDGALTVAMAALTAVVLGVGGRSLDADGPETVRALQVTPDGSPVALMGGCEVTARPASSPTTAGAGAVVILSARNPGGAPTDLELVVSVEKREMRPESMMRRVISADDFIVTEVARESARWTVPAGETAELPLKLLLPAGDYSVSARRSAESGDGTALCSLVVLGAEESPDPGEEPPATESETAGEEPVAAVLERAGDELAAAASGIPGRQP